MVIREEDIYLPRPEPEQRCGYCAKPVKVPVVWWHGPAWAFYMHPDCAAAFALQVLTDAHKAGDGRDLLTQAVRGNKAHDES